MEYAPPPYSTPSQQHPSQEWTEVKDLYIDSLWESMQRETLEPTEKMQMKTPEEFEATGTSTIRTH